MIDSLKKLSFFKKTLFQKYKDMNGVLTIHRPENVDNKKRLIEIISELKNGLSIIRYFSLFILELKKKLIKFKLINDLNAISNLKV